MSDKKAAAAETASKSSAKTEKKPSKKYQNPFSFTDPLQVKFINCIMKNGKKTVAQRILSETFDEIHKRTSDDPLRIFEKAYQNATPTIEVKPKRIGGAVYQIPMEVKPKRQESLSIRWLLEGARKKKGRPMVSRLAEELIDCSNDAGYAFGKKEEVHKMAQANKAFAHLARY